MISSRLAVWSWLRGRPAVALVVIGVISEAVYLVYVLLFPLRVYGYASRPYDMEQIARQRPWMGTAWVLGLILLFGLYFVALRLIEARRMPLWPILGFGLAFGLTLVWLYPVTATDLFQYVMRARVQVVHQSNPMTVPPGRFPDDPLLPIVGEWKVGYGTPIGSHWPPITPYYVDLTKKYPYDPKKAKELLAKAGYPNGFEATIKLPVIYPYAQKAGEVIADMLGQIGIKLKIEIVEWGFWLDRVFKQKEFELSMIGHAESWDIGIYANPNYYFLYDSKEFQEAYSKAVKAATEAEKAKWFARCQEIVAEDAVNGFLFASPSLSAMKPS